MWLDLKDVIEIPGAVVPFSCELSTDELVFTAVKTFTAPPKVSGRVKNTAGLMALTGELDADMICICDRCGKEFAMHKHMELDVPLQADLENEPDADVFPVENNGIDVDDVLRTCFVLDMDTKFLCSESCKGLCPTCGKNLNEGPCGCVKAKDPRLAVLGQLLDIDNK